MPTYTTYYNLAKPDVNSPTDEDLWGSELNDNMDIIDSTLHTLATGSPAVPTGTVSAFAGSTAPSGWQLCYGQAISRSTYATLFSVIGTTYGVGDGSTTFNLPDLRGRITAGKDNMGGTSASRLTNSPTGGVNGNTLGNTGGSQGHTLTEAQLATHDHTASSTAPSLSGTLELAAGPGTVSTRIANNNGTSVSTLQRGNTSTATTVSISGSASAPTITVNNAGSGSSHNNVQPTIILNYIIKE